MKKLKRTISLLMGLLMVSALPGISAMASLSDSGVSVDGSDIPDSEPGKISYSDTYDPIRWIRPGTDGRNGSGNDPWRNGLVTGNGQNGLIDDGAPENGTLIYQNMQFNFPSNDQRETPELASVMDEVKQTIVNGGSPSSASSTSASSILNSRAGEWSYENGLTSGRSWSLKNTYTFHPGMQLRLEMNGLENGAEDSFYRYTNYETAEIGAVWSDENGEWERKSFSSREDNVTITSVKATDGNKSFSMDLSIDDISDMSSENKMSGSVEDLRYKKFYKNSDGELYIGSVAHYPNYENSELKDGGFAGVSKIIVKGEGAEINITEGAAPVDDRTDEQKNSGVPNETVINVSGSSVGSDYTFNADPTVSVTNAEEIIVITKSARDKEMGAFDDFAGATSYALVAELVADTNSAAAKYTTDGVFSYDAALAPHAAEHGEIFGRAELNLNASEADRALANEDLIAKAKTEGESGTLNLAMLERMYYNGRYANVCCSGYQVPRLGGMWTGAWKVEWSGDYTTDANINLQVAGNNIGAMPESSQGFINFLLRTASDWEINAKQVYGIDDAIFVPTRIDGDRAMVVHFSMSFPGHIWNSGASWMLLPVYEYWQCYGNQRIPLADDVRELLEVTENTYNMATQWYSDEEPAKVNDTVYNLRNTLGLTDERAEQILEQGYFDLEKDILFPLLTKTCNFYTGLLTPEYYTKDGKGYYEEGKTELAEDEYYMFVPSYSPENCPEGYSGQSYLQMNASMDIAAARDCFNMAQEIVAAVGGENIDGNVITADTQKWQSYKEKLPPYLYEPTGELKEWAISDYGENYGHRHISQLYGLWPGYEANNDPALFDGAKALIATKNSYPSNDNVAGHSWVHKGLISARAKSSEGVKDALLPIVSQEMHYNSMMTAHNTSGNQAYCTDGAITPPAILIESLLYSDDQTVEILPAVIDEMFEAGGSVTGLKTRSGGDVSELKWTSESAEMTITSAEEINLKCGRAVESVTINGEPAELAADENGEPCVKVSGENVKIVFSFADINNGTYTISTESGGVTPQTSIDMSAVVTGESAGEAAKWNIERKADGTYTIENALHGRYLVNNGSDVYMKRTPGQDESAYWCLDESGYISAMNGQYLCLENGELTLGTDGTVFTFTAEPETLTQYSADSITISAEGDTSQPVNPGTMIDFTAEVTPAAAESKTIFWNVKAEDGTQLTRTQFADNTLRIGTDALSKTLIVTAQSEDGACLSNELRITVSDTVQDELKFSPVQDVFVSGWSNSSTSDKDTNYGDDSHDYLTTTNTKNTDKKYTLIKFDIPALGAEVKTELSSELVLTYMEQTEPDGIAYYAYEYTGDWDESSATWNSISGDSYDKGDAIAEGVYDRETKQMSFTLPADYIKNNSGKTVTLLIDSPDAPGVRTFWYSRESGDENTAPAINFSYIVDTTQVKTVTYGPYWADEVENHQGSSGDDATNDFGNFKNVDDTIKVFFPNAEDGATIGSFKRINGIDNGSNGGWKGYVTKTIDAEGAGDYTIYVLGNTNAADRSVEITNETTGESAVSELSADLTEYSTSNYMRVFSVELRLERGENILRIQAPEGKAAPNFIALLATGEIYGSSEDNPPTATPPTSAPTPTATIAPTQAPTAAPTTTPTAAPTATPTQTPAAAYEIISYSVTNDGEKAVVESANVRVENAENVTLYTAAYNDEGVLVGFAESAVEESGESSVVIGLETDPANTVKMFLWRDMQPLTEEKNVALDAEETERITKNFNRDWKFAYSGAELAAQDIDYDDSEWAEVALPYSFSIPYDLNQSSFYIGYGWYRKNFEIPANWDDKFISIDFEGVFQVADIYINGVHVPQSNVYGYEDRTDADAPTHEGGYSGFSVDITDYVAAGSENTIAVRVDNIWQADLVPRGGDHQFSGGIYRDVTLTAVNKTHVDWYGTFVWTPAICNPSYQVSENRPDDQYGGDFERYGTGITNTLDDPNVEGEYVSEEDMLANLAAKTSDVEVQAELTNSSDESLSIYVVNTIKNENGEPVAEFRSDAVTFAPGERRIITSRSEMIENIELWSFDDPNLYTVETVVYTSGGTRIDNFETEFGFRSAQFKLDGFYLNGEKTLLDGANAHQDHGGWADAVTDAGFYRDVEYVKEAGFNFIRGSHYPHDPAFAEACDELGVAFWSEGGLWSIGGWNDDDTVNMQPSDWYRGSYPSQEQYREAFEQSCYDMVESMIRVNRNHPSIILWSMGNEAFFTEDTEEVNASVKELIAGLRDYAHSLDYTRKAGLGGTQRRDLNVLAVCDVAGGNGDGGTERYTNFYLPHLVAEYSSDVNDRPGDAEFHYDQIEDPSDPTKYVLPSKTITLADGTTAESSSAGLSIWCMYHHGSVGGANLRKMGLMDYYRLPTDRYYMYREDRTGKDIPEGSADGTAAAILLEGSAGITLDDVKTDVLTMTNDGKSDVQLVATMVDENGNWVGDTRDMVIEVVEGNGVFPTGKSYTFEAGTTIQDGKAAIEFRSYYSGETKIRAYIPGADIESNVITVRTENVLGIDEGSEPENFMVADTSTVLPSLTEPESYGGFDAAYNRQSRADSTSEDTLPYNAIDGDDDTYWQAGTTGNQSWYVFLENSYYLQKVKVNQGEDPAAYTIYYAPSGTDSEWIKVADCTGSEPEIDFGGVYASGIRVEFTGVESDEYAKLYSLNAYGTTATGYAQNSVSLSDLTPARDIVQGWEGMTPGIDQSIEGNPITLGGVVYEKGLGLHADSEAVYDLDQNYSRFTAAIGIDDEVGAYRSDGKDGATFRVYVTVKNSSGDDTEMLVYENTLYDTGDTATVDISVEGASRLRLVTDKISNNSKDHTDWANPTLWGVLRDISLTESIDVYASRGAADSPGDVNIRLSGENAPGEYTANMYFMNATGSEIGKYETTLTALDTVSVHSVSADTAPEEYGYAVIEILDQTGTVIGRGIL